MVDNRISQCQDSCPVVRNSQADAGAIILFDSIPTGGEKRAFLAANDIATAKGFRMVQGGMCTEKGLSGADGRTDGWCFVKNARKEY